MKLAFFSDIHGNSIALEAVLEEIGREDVDFAVCGGDLVGYGPFPNEVIAMLHASRIPTIMGNYDQGVGFDLPECGCAYLDEAAAALGRHSLLWTQAAVTPENKTRLRSLLARLAFESAGRRALFVHGSPRKINEYLYEDRPLASVARLFDAEKADLIGCGHTHQPYVRQVGEALLVNPGSVGRPKDGDPRAAYAVITMTRDEMQAEIRRIAYDVERAAGAVSASGLPPEFADNLRRGA